MITYTGDNSVGINNTGWVNTVGGNDIGNHNVTIRNCVIFDENTGTTTNRYGIYFRFAENGTIETTSSIPPIQNLQVLFWNHRIVTIFLITALS